mmetsp:Transcript_90275/g.254763  ORF Transcript_90275/g.254763 Transcript_90275/m.254763 type:complete len:232 (-) Transcript_90275:691-1386(-)
MCEAACKAVLSVPSRTTKLTSASFLSKYLQMSTCPALAAAIRGTTPISGSDMLMLAFAWMSSAATVRLPCSHSRTRTRAASTEPSKSFIWVKSWSVSKQGSSSSSSDGPLTFGGGAYFGAAPDGVRGAGFASPTSSIITTSCCMRRSCLPSTKAQAASRASREASRKVSSPEPRSACNRAANASTSASSAILWQLSCATTVCRDCSIVRAPDLSTGRVSVASLIAIPTTSS